MRILYVDLEREWRGGQSQALLTVRGRHADGHDAQLVSVRESPVARRATSAGIVVHEVGKNARRASAALLLRKLLSQQNYDVLHANEPHALTAAWLAGAQERTRIVVSRRVAYPLSASGLAGERYSKARGRRGIFPFGGENLLGTGVPNPRMRHSS